MPTILLIDDDVPMRSSLRRSLEREGYAVIEAGAPDEALAHLKKSEVDLVVTDIIMPGGDGMELLFTLRRSYPKLRVMVITGGGQLGPEFHLDLASRAGAVSVLAKPFPPEVLLRQVSSILGTNPSAKD